MRTNNEQIKNLIANVATHGNIGKFVYASKPDKVTYYKFENGFALTLAEMKAFSNIMKLGY